MALTEALIKEAGERYVREQDRYAKLAHFVADTCQREVVDTNVIRATVQWRAKARKRFEAKLLKWLAAPQKKEQVEKISTLDDVFEQMGGDLAGVRITTYVETDRDRVVDVIKRHFDGSGGSVEVDKKDEAARKRRSRYRATHCQVRLKPDDLVGTYENLDGLSCEIQVCSLLAHVWNEIEHDLGYKPLSGPLSAIEKDLLEVLGRETETGDFVIASLLAEKERRSTGDKNEVFIDEYDFVVRMRERFPGATDFGANAGQLYEELVDLGMDTPQKIEQGLLQDGQDKAEKLIQQLIKHMQANNDLTVWIEPESSDQLLVLLLEKHLDEVIERHPAGRGMGRPPRIVSFAKRFRDMKAAQARQGSRVAVG